MKKITLKTESLNTKPMNPEIVTKIVVDKIMSFVNKEINANRVKRLIPSYCLNYCENTIKTFINASNIIQENENNIDLEGYTISQPSLSVIERDSGSQIHMDKIEGIPFNDNSFQFSEIERQKTNIVSSPRRIPQTNINKNNIFRLKASNSGNNIIKKDIITINPSFDLTSNPNGINRESPEIDDLRKEMIIEMERREREIQSEKRKLLLNSKSASNINEQSKKTIFEMKKITFDSKGKIIPLRYLSVESFRKDFDVPKAEIRDDSTKIISSSLPKLSKKEEPVVHTNIIPIANSNSSLNINLNRKVYRRDDQSSKRIGIRCECSGDNFEQMIPSPGVTITSQQNLKTKKGDINYKRDFKKISLAEYKYLSEDVLPNITSPLLNSIKEPPSLELSTNANNDSKTSRTFNIKAFSGKNEIRPLYLTKRDNSYSKDHIANMIRLKSKSEISLKHLFNDNNDQTTLIEEDALNKRKPKNNTHFFLSKKERIVPLLSYEQIDRFNRIIIQDHNWGKTKAEHFSSNKNMISTNRIPIKKDNTTNGMIDNRIRKFLFRK